MTSESKQEKKWIKVGVGLLGQIGKADYGTMESQETDAYCAGKRWFSKNNPTNFVVSEVSPVYADKPIPCGAMIAGRKSAFSSISRNTLYDPQIDEPDCSAGTEVQN
jgi:hypothetical protein